VKERARFAPNPHLKARGARHDCALKPPVSYSAAVETITFGDHEIGIGDCVDQRQAVLNGCGELGNMETALATE